MVWTWAGLGVGWTGHGMAWACILGISWPGYVLACAWACLGIGSLGMVLFVHVLASVFSGLAWACLGIDWAAHGLAWA
jgi:hypothetical protein